MIWLEIIKLMSRKKEKAACVHTILFLIPTVPILFKSLFIKHIKQEAK